MVRVVLDAAGGQGVKVAHVTSQQLQLPQDEVLHSAKEPDWESPRPEDWGLGGGWGSQRVLLASGLSCVSTEIGWVGGWASRGWAREGGWEGFDACMHYSCNSLYILNMWPHLRQD